MFEGNKDVKDCCKLEENLELQPSDKPELVIRKCRICQCRHFELTLDPAEIGLVGAKL
jgi:hypothetical protein